MAQFEAGTHVEILAFSEPGTTRKSRWDHEFNRYAVINSGQPVNGKWWLTNVNMPYQGTISGFYSEDEFKVVSNG